MRSPSKIHFLSNFASRFSKTAAAFLRLIPCRYLRITSRNAPTGVTADPSISAPIRGTDDVVDHRQRTLGAPTIAVTGSIGMQELAFVARSFEHGGARQIVP